MREVEGKSAVGHAPDALGVFTTPKEVIDHHHLFCTEGTAGDQHETSSSKQVMGRETVVEGSP